MPTFAYTAINDQGIETKGTLKASSEDAVQGALVSQGAIPLTVKEVKGKKSTQGGTLQALLTPIKPTEIIIFTKQMRTMLKSGIPILKIMGILQEQTTNERMRSAMAAMEKDVQEGATLTSVFKKHPSIFNNLYCGLINAGETSGTMIEVLDRVTYILEHEFKVRRDIKSALAYPKMVVIVLCGAFLFLLNFVIPKFIGVFQKAGLELPMPTKVCLAMYNGMQAYWPLMLGTIIALFFSAKMYFATPVGAVMRDSALTKIPIVGPLFIKSAMSRFASILAILLSSGVSVLSSFEILAETIGNAAIAKEFKGLAKQMEAGSGISDPLRKAHYFPPMVVNMVAIGEESGSLEDMLSEVANHYDEEVEYAVSGLAEAIGPIMIVLLTAVVGFFALAIFLPMWDLTKMVK